MRPLGASDVIALWEVRRAREPLDVALQAIDAAFPEPNGESAADWPIGRRNRALLELRRAGFGPVLRGWVYCRGCSEPLEFGLDSRDVLSAASSPQRDVWVGRRTFRLPTSRDLVEIRGDDPDAAALRLAQRCFAGDSSAHLDSDDLDDIGRQMALADPLAEIALHFDCPACGESFDESLDLPAFVCAEIEGLAKRLLRDVHVLARAYTWSESEILSLSPARREFYLSLVSA